jgi:hypothetical protein
VQKEEGGRGGARGRTRRVSRRVPLDSEQRAAEKGIKTPAQQRTIDTWRQEIAQRESDQQ